MNFLVPYTKTLDTKNDTVISNKSFDESHFHELKGEEQASYEHEIMQDEDSANGMEANIVYEAYEIAEPLSASTSTGQSQGKSQITLVRSSTANSTQNVQLSASPQKTQTQIHQIQTQQQTPIATGSQMPVQNTIYPVSDDQSSADLNFFLALLPDVKVMNQEQKRVFRLGALKLIDEILSGNR